MRTDDCTIVTTQISRGIIFSDPFVILIDIDTIFRNTNKFFSKLLLDMGIQTTFDFSNTYNKRLYTHAFLTTICNSIKHTSENNKWFFYSNPLTKDPFRNKLLVKLRRIFGFCVFEDVRDFADIITNIKENDAETISKLEIFFATNKKPKTFKHIKRYLEKTGLTILSDEYFKDMANRMLIIG